MTKFYFNYDFRSGSASASFIRVACVLDNGTLFGTMIREGSKVQRFSMLNYDFNKHVKGIVDGSCFDEELFFSSLDHASDKVKDCFQTCLSDLNRSFRAHVQKCSISKGFSYSAQTEVYGKISSLRENFMKKILGESVEIKKESQEEFTEISDMDGSLLDKVITATFENEDKVVEVEGSFYVLKSVENGEYKIFKTNKPAEENKTQIEEKNDKIVVPMKVIKTKKMAFCKDDIDLINFNKNELYELISSESPYLKVRDIYGNQVFVREKRFEIIDVVDDKLENVEF